MSELLLVAKMHVMRQTNAGSGMQALHWQLWQEWSGCLCWSVWMVCVQMGKEHWESYGLRENGLLGAISASTLLRAVLLLVFSPLLRFLFIIMMLADPGCNFATCYNRRWWLRCIAIVKQKIIVSHVPFWHWFLCCLLVFLDRSHFKVACKL